MSDKTTTVMDLIAALSTYPPDADVWVKDADTGWYLGILDIDTNGKEVRLISDYHEAINRDPRARWEAE